MIWRMDGLNQSFLYVEASEDLRQACMPDFVKFLHEVYEVVEQILLMLYVLLSDDSAIEDLLCCAPAWSLVVGWAQCTDLQTGL